VRNNVEVDVNTTVRIDFKLELGTITESVTASGESPVLQTDRTIPGASSRATRLPPCPSGSVAISRECWRPCRARGPSATFEFSTRRTRSTNVNGQSRLANNVLIEGIDDNHKPDC
jgi:hypothetical protein